MEIPNLANASDEKVEILENKVKHLTQMMASFMNQMFTDPLPPPTQETNQNVPRWPIPPLTLNISHTNVPAIHPQASNDTSLSEGGK